MWTKVELSAEVARLVEVYLAAAPDSKTRRIAENLSALPVLEDVGGVMLLRDDGSVCVVPWDSDRTDPMSASALETKATLVAAAERHPSLAPLVPMRPDNAEECENCLGKGSVAVSMSTGSIRCGVCGGLGWIETPGSA